MATNTTQARAHGHGKNKDLKVLRGVLGKTVV
jgi:hypothetical protein